MILEFLVVSAVILFAVCVGYILGIAGGFREKEESRVFYPPTSVAYEPPGSDEKIVDYP